MCSHMDYNVNDILDKLSIYICDGRAFSVLKCSGNLCDCVCQISIGVGNSLQ